MLLTTSLTPSPWPPGCCPLLGSPLLAVAPSHGLLAAWVSACWLRTDAARGSACSNLLRSSAPSHGDPSQRPQTHDPRLSAGTWFSPELRADSSSGHPRHLTLSPSFPGHHPQLCFLPGHIGLGGCVPIFPQHTSLTQGVVPPLR